MEAKDTVMKPNEYAKIIERYKESPQSNFASGRSDLVEQLNKAQAEITWPIAKKVGIREVVEKLVGQNKVSDRLRHAMAGLGANIAFIENKEVKELAKHWLNGIEIQTRLIEQLGKPN